MFTQINNDLIAVMKSGDKFNLSVLRMLKSVIKNEEISKKSELSDDEVITIIKKQVKIRKDSKEEYEGYGRNDLADNLEKEIAVLSKYLPEEMSAEEINKIVSETITELGATDLKALGAVMKAVGSICGSKADMKVVSTIVKEKLSN